MSNDTDQILSEDGISNSEDAEFVISSASSGAPSFIRERVFPFLELPPEIRNMIYRIVLVGDEPVYIYCHDPCSEVYQGCYCSYEYRVRPTPVPQVKKDLEILLVNRQIWTEASELFYSDNIFDFDLSLPGPRRKGFHPNLKRMRKCCLCGIEGMSGHQSFDNYLTDLISTFANSLSEAKQLRFLLISAYGRTFLQPLEALRGIWHVQVKLRANGYVLARNLVIGLTSRVLLKKLPAHSTPRKRLDYAYRLSLLMMSNGQYTQIEDIAEEGVRMSEDVLAKLGKGNQDDVEFERMKSVCRFN